MDHITSQDQLDKATQEHGSFILIFSAVWSSPGENTRANFERLGANHSALYLAWISTDENPEIAESHGVNAIPTTIGYKGGVEVARYTGPQFGDDQVERFIQKVL